MDKFEQLRKMYKDAGVSIYAYKPSALSENNTDAEIEYALRAAKALGATHVTVELPKSSDHSKRLGLLANKHKIAVAYHGHLQQTINSWDEAIATIASRIKFRLKSVLAMPAEKKAKQLMALPSVSLVTVAPSSWRASRCVPGLPAC